jgi:hypothetical protein
MLVDHSWSFTTESSQTSQYSIWSDTDIPATVTVWDPNSVELGVRFRTSTAGLITGLRFYKGPQNTGTHVGNLWQADGTLLASVTFTNETASGWQQADLPIPIPVAADTTYIASYHTNAGYYSVNAAYFASSGFSNPPLTALRNGEDGGNGVYIYGVSAFPSYAYNSNNYWVDVVFKPQD